MTSTENIVTVPNSEMTVRQLLKKLTGKSKYVTHPIGVTTSKEHREEFQTMAYHKRKKIHTHKWTKQEEDAFLAMIQERQEMELDDMDWSYYLCRFPMRTPHAIRRKYTRLAQNLTYSRGAWSEQEIVNLAFGVKQYGSKCHLIREAMGNVRSTSNIRQKWVQLCQKLCKHNAISDNAEAADAIITALSDVPCTLNSIEKEQQ